MILQLSSMLPRLGPVLLQATLGIPGIGFGVSLGKFLNLAIGENIFLGGLIFDQLGKIGVASTERLSKASRLQQRAAVNRARITGERIGRVEDPFRAGGFSIVTQSQFNQPGLVAQLQEEAAIRRLVPQIQTALGFTPDTPAQIARMRSGGEFPFTAAQRAAAARLPGGGLA